MHGGNLPSWRQHLHSMIYCTLEFAQLCSLLREKSGVLRQTHAAAIGIVEQIPQYPRANAAI
jgi:hypothetical protein